mgnify:CR=1 FL=1
MLYLCNRKKESKVLDELNNYLNTSFRVSHQTFEIAEQIENSGRQPVSFNSDVDNSTLELQFEEKAVLKKMYNVHYYDQQLRRK